MDAVRCRTYFSGLIGMLVVAPTVLGAYSQLRYKEGFSDVFEAWVVLAVCRSSR